MGSLYKLSLGSMFETPAVSVSRQNREREEREDKLFERELQLREKELELREKEINLELMKLNNEKENIVKGLIFD